MKASHQGGLSPNKQNKYSIRKYTVGTASLLIGTTLIFGVHAKDASAAEEVAKQTQLAEEKTEDTAEATGESDSDLIPEVPTQDTNQDNAIEDLPEEGATSEKTVNNAEQTQEDETVVEKKQGEDKASSKTQPTPTKKSNENEKAATVDENKEQQATVAERKAVVSQPQETEKSNATNTTPTTTESTPQPKQLAETMKQVTALEDSQEKEAKLVDYYSKNTGVSPEAAKQAVQGMNLDYQNLDSDRLTAEMLIALANKQEQNTPKATPVSIKANNSKFRSVSLDKTANFNTLVVDNNKGITNIQTTIIDRDKEKGGDNDGIIYPHKYGYLDIQTKFDVANSVKSGDTFQIKYSNNIQISDFFEDRVTPPSIYNSGGELIAKGSYDLNTRTITYTFTNFVNTHNDVSAQLNLLGYVERDVVKQQGKHNFEVTVAGETISKTLDVKYQDIYRNNNVTINSFYDEYDNVTGEYSQISYINPSGDYINNPVVEIFGYGFNKTPGSSSAVVSNKDTVKVYEVPTNVTLADSYKPEFSKLKELRSGVDYKLDYDSNKPNAVSIKNLSNGTKKYVIFTKGKQDLSLKQPLVQRVSLAANDYNNKIRSIVYSENYIETQDSSGVGKGDLTYKLGNRVWEDVNNNDVQDISDKGIPNVTVTLKNINTKEVIDTTKTDGDGYYLFNNLKNGDYLVEFSDPKVNEKGQKYVPVKEHVGNSEVDSDLQSVVATIRDADNLTIDRGFEVLPDPKYKLGDRVWEDINKNGVQDKDEKGVQGVLVNVFNSKNQLVDTVTTNEKGEYSVPNLPNGEYKVEFKNIPAGYTISPSEQGNDRSVDSNGLSSVITIKDEDNLTADLGIYKEIYKVGDKVWEDTNKDGIQQDTEVGISGVKVTLKDKDGKVLETKTTDEKGNYLFENVAKGEYTVEFETPQGYKPTVTGKGELDKDSNGTSAEITVTQNDLTIDSGFYKPTYSLGDKVWEDTNKNGIQDKDEKGVQGVLVNVFNSKNQLVDTVTTNEKGEYSVPNLPNGEYKVEFKNIPAGYTVSPTEQGNDRSVDSNGLSSVITIKDEDNLTADLGIYQPTFKVGDKVWEDSNKDGIQQDIEPGISGVKVTLKDKDGKVVETKTTDEKGNYLFENVANGDYTIEFETPEGYKPTEIGKGDADKDSNGTSAKVTVDKDDITIDSGFYKPTYSLGDRVWEDTYKNGIQDEDEKGIKGVKVTLKDSTGEELDTTVTNDKGEYEFKDLPNGEYQVDFETPEGYVPTVANTEDDTKDSDGPLNAKGVIKDEDNLTVDQG
uniref:SdrD B-like domain-containing protein n=1 Tax=Staphylococcus coagulans TaxID=74706 RepID=UPI0033651C46